MAVSAAVDFILFRQRDSSRILAYTSSSGKPIDYTTIQPKPNPGPKPKSN